MNRVAAERKLQDLTQIELASKLQVSPSTVVWWIGVSDLSCCSIPQFQTV